MTGLTTIGFIGNLAGGDMIVLLIIALLIFGRRLPEVGKNLGKTIVEFKKGLNGGLETEPPEEPVAPVKRPVTRLSATTTLPTAKRLAQQEQSEEV